MGVDASQLSLALPCRIAQFKASLGKQGGQRGIQGMADIEIFAFFAQIDWAQAHGEQRAAQLLQNLPHRLARRQLAPALLANAAAITGAPLLTGARRPLTMLCNCQCADEGCSLTVFSCRIGHLMVSPGPRKGRACLHAIHSTANQPLGKNNALFHPALSQA